MNAGGSSAAQEFTTRYCDMNFVILKDRTFLEGARGQIAQLKQMARSNGRETRIWIHVYVVCRETEKEAQDYLHHYVYEKGDWEAAGNLLRIFGSRAETLDKQNPRAHKAHFIAGHCGYPLVGTAEQIADELGKLSEIGVDGCLISWVDYKNELPSNGMKRCSRCWYRPACGRSSYLAGGSAAGAAVQGRSCNDGLSSMTCTRCTV